MKLMCIACEVLARPIYLSAAYSPNTVDVELLKRGLHNTPAKLREQLQALINTSGDQGYDAVVLGYGLCGQATASLAASSVPLIIPRAHDCITLFLGSRQRYNDQFQKYPGTYWYEQDYVERDDGSGSALSLGSGTDVELEKVYDEYVEKYGKENADYLMEVMGAWQGHYQRAAYIDLGLGGGGTGERRAQADAIRRGWTFEKLAGELVLIRRLLNGEWDSDFLTVPPGSKISISYDDEIISCIK